MSQRTDERDPTKVNLLVYDKVLKLTDHVMSVCKPKDKNVNNHHIPKKNVSIGKILMDCAVELGADILEANGIYVGKNIGTEKLISNYEKRIELQDHAKSLTFRMEHIFRVLHFDKEFAESTSRFMMGLICETRDLLTKWREADMKNLRSLRE